MANIEHDIKRFAEHGDFLKTMKEDQEMLPISDMMREVAKRSALYIEFLAGAFLQETGLKANETELVIEFGIDKIKYSFRKKADNEKCAP